MDKVALKLVKFLRVTSDMYFKDNLVYRAMMLETVAAVPGYVRNTPYMAIGGLQVTFFAATTCFPSFCSLSSHPDWQLEFFSW